MNIKNNKRGQIVAVSKYGEECIHLVHCEPNLVELKKDIANIYVVAEECTNFPRLHLITSFSETEAMECIDTYLREKEGVEHSHIISAIPINEVLS